MVETTSTEDAGDPATSTSDDIHPPAAPLQSPGDVPALLPRMAYQMGFASAHLVRARPLAMAPGQRGRGLAWPYLKPMFVDFQLGLRELAAALHDNSLRATCEGFLAAADNAWQHFNSNWQGDFHCRMIEHRESSDPEMLPPTWDHDVSILRKCPWVEYRRAMDELVGALPDELSLCWRTGSLISQVSELNWDDGQQIALLGEEHPIRPLQTKLLELRSRFEQLRGVDVELDSVDVCGIALGNYILLAQKKAEQIHGKILQRLSSLGPGRTVEPVGSDRNTGTPAAPANAPSDNPGGAAGTGAPRPATMQSAGIAAAQALAGEEYIFRRHGKGWMIRYGTSPVIQLPWLDGLFYPHCLVHNPAKRFTPTELRSAKAKYDQEARRSSPVTVEMAVDREDRPQVAADAGDLIDDEALGAYRKAIERLDELIEDAIQMGERKPRRRVCKQKRTPSRNNCEPPWAVAAGGGQKISLSWQKRP